MPVSFLSTEQRENYGRYTGVPSLQDLARYFHLDDADHALIAKKRGDHNRLGFAVQLSTARYLSTFLDDPFAVPVAVLQTLAKQLRIDPVEGTSAYSSGEQRWLHATEIRESYGYVEITEQRAAFRLTRWLYALCWTGTDRPSVLFERGITWLVMHKVLLPGCSTLERYIARLRSRVEERLWRYRGPGTLRDSLILLAVVLEQQTEVQPTQIMTDTGAYSDVVFGLFRLLGYRFCPRLADVGGTRFWRIDQKADYGLLNSVSAHHLSLQKIAPHWGGMLRLAGSLKLGRVPATGIMRTLQVGDRPTRLALAIAEFGRIDKTLHSLTYIDDEAKRRATLTQLNRGEGRHSVGRAVFHGRRGELRQHYREGQEDQLGALGLVLNMIVLWNTIYIEATLNQLRTEGYLVKDEDVHCLSPLQHEHINMMGRYSFSMPDAVAKGELRPLRIPENTNS